MKNSWLLFFSWPRTFREPQVSACVQLSDGQWNDMPVANSQHMCACRRWQLRIAPGSWRSTGWSTIFLPRSACGFWIGTSHCDISWHLWHLPSGLLMTWMRPTPLVRQGQGSGWSTPWMISPRSITAPSRLHHGSITAPFVTIVCRIYPYIVCPTVQAFVHFFPNILAYLSSSLCHPASYPIHLECLVPHSRLEDKQNCPWLPGWAVTTSCVCHPFTPHLILSSTDMPSLCARASTFHCALWVLKLPGSVKNHHPSPDPSCCQGTRALSISVKNTALQIQIVRTSWGISAAACRCTHPEWLHMLVMR